MAKLVAQDGIARIPLRSLSGAVRAYALVDTDLEPTLSAYTWGLSLGYAVRIGLSDGKRRGIRMHRAIMGAPDGLEVDHINRNRLDNRRANLRLATDAEQAQNLSKAKTYRGQLPTSQYRGVCWISRRRRWRAQVYIAGAIVFSKTFRDEAEAGAAAAAARLKWMSHTVEDIDPARIPAGKIDRQPATAEPSTTAVA